MVPSERTVTVAVGHGKKAARHIDAWLRDGAYHPAPKRELAQFASNEELVCEVDASGLSLDVKDVSVLDGWPAPLQRAAKELLGQSSDPVARKALAQLAGLVSAT
jgi:hypothetical protein